jgi:hypothetical protein
MTIIELTRLNRIFGDKLGLIPTGFPQSGEPVFQYKRAGELTYPAPYDTEIRTSEGGLSYAQLVYRQELQLPEYQPNVWCIAKWLEPGYSPPDMTGAFGEPGEPVILSPSEWERRFGRDMAYPSGGWWLAIQPLRPGYQPDEKWTHWAADNLHIQRSLSLRDTFRMMMSRNEKKQAHRDSEIRAMTRDCFTNHVPGARGGSYIAFNEAPERKERYL